MYTTTPSLQSQQAQQQQLKTYQAKTVSNTVVNHGGFSRQALIEWVNEDAGGETNYRKIEQLCDGIGYCILIEKIFPGCIQLSKIKRDVKTDVNKIWNLKLLQGAMTRCKVPQDVPINLLTKAKYQDNYEYAQWFKKFYDANVDLNVSDENKPVYRATSKSIRASSSPSPFKANKLRFKGNILKEKQESNLKECDKCLESAEKISELQAELNEIKKQQAVMRNDESISSDAPLPKNVIDMAEDLSGLINSAPDQFLKIADVLEIFQFHQVKLQIDDAEISF